MSRKIRKGQRNRDRPGTDIDPQRKHRASYCLVFVIVAVHFTLHSIYAAMRLSLCVFLSAPPFVCVLFFHPLLFHPLPELHNS